MVEDGGDGCRSHMKVLVAGATIGRNGRKKQRREEENEEGKMDNEVEEGGYLFKCAMYDCIGPFGGDGVVPLHQDRMVLSL